MTPLTCPTHPTIRLFCPACMGRLGGAVLTVPQAAAHLGMSVQATWQAIREGRLASEPGAVSRVMVPRAAVRAYRRNATKQRAGRTRPR